jgi:hypothetical protein
MENARPNREFSWPLWVLVIGLGVLLIAATSAGITWLALRSERSTLPSSGALRAASESSERDTPVRREDALARAPLTCAKVTSCCRQIALRSSGPPGNCDGFLQLADQACKQALEGFRDTAGRLGLRCD